jgi:hypothetical protein
LWRHLQRLWPSGPLLTPILTQRELSHFGLRQCGRRLQQENLTGLRQLDPTPDPIEQVGVAFARLAVDHKRHRVPFLATAGAENSLCDLQHRHALAEALSCQLQDPHEADGNHPGTAELVGTTGTASASNSKTPLAEQEDCPKL